MKITHIDRFPINLHPVKVGYRGEDSLSAIAKVHTIIIRINTDEGITGLGEAATIRSYFNQTQRAMMNWLEGYEHVLIGEDPLDIINAHLKMDVISGENHQVVIQLEQLLTWPYMI